MLCTTPGCPQQALTTSPQCYFHTKVTDSLITGYYEGHPQGSIALDWHSIAPERDWSDEGWRIQQAARGKRGKWFSPGIFKAGLWDQHVLRFLKLMG